MRPIDEEPTDTEDDPQSSWHRLQIQITPAQYKWLNEQRFKRGKSIGYLIRELIENVGRPKD